MNDDFTDDCVTRAIRKKRTDFGGKARVYYVATIGPLNIDHAYIVPEGANPNDLAIDPVNYGLAQHDLKIHQVLEYGTEFVEREGKIIPNLPK